MAAPLFFVPLAVAGGRVFFKFATKKAAQAFKGRFAKAGGVTTRTPPKSATVTTTGSNRGKAIIKDMTKPVTQPRISPRNPNTTKLPKAPKRRGGGKAAGAAAATATVAAGSTSTSKEAGTATRSKPTKTSDQARSEARVADRQRRLAAKSAAQGGGSVLSKKKKSGASKMSTPTPPPKRPKKKQKMYTPIDPKTGKPDFDAPKVTAAERLKQEDKFKAFKKRKGK